MTEISKTVAILFHPVLDGIFFTDMKYDRRAVRWTNSLFLLIPIISKMPANIHSDKTVDKIVLQE